MAIKNFSISSAPKSIGADAEPTRVFAAESQPALLSENDPGKDVNEFIGSQPSFGVMQEQGNSARPADQQKGGWVSPTYFKSRSVKLNPQLLTENRCFTYQHEAAEHEYYRMIRTHILQQTGGKGNTIMVTSAGAGEGKTVTAINLAFAFAREYKQTALLVDCDLKRQQICERFGFSGEKGIVDFLIDNTPLSDVIVWPGVDKLTVISGGRSVKDRSELIGSLGMKNMVEEMKSRYTDRYIIFDTPPLLTCADALALVPLVDHVLVVVQAGKTSRQDINTALKLLPGEKVLGLVMNRQKNAG